MQKSLIAIIITGFFTLTAWAADPIAKEETTPPPAEGPFTADQIPPYNSMPLANQSLPQLKPNTNGQIPVPTNPASTITNPEQLTPPAQSPVTQPQFSSPQAPSAQPQFSPPQPPSTQPQFAPSQTPSTE